MPSYHDVEIEIITDESTNRMLLFNMPYGVELECTRVGGWRLWNCWTELLAGEYDTPQLKVYVKGHQICGAEDEPQGGTNADTP